VEETSRNSPRGSQALFVLGGWPHPDAQGVWHSSLFENGRIGDRLRVEAAASLYQADPQLVIVTGGNRKLAHIPEVPACAAVMKRELIELGLAASDILEELKSGNTYEQLQFIKAVFDQFPITTLRILSNRYHLARIDAFLNDDAQLQQWCAQRRIQLEPAEEIVLMHDPSRWHRVITEAYASRAMQDRIEQELRGAQAIRAGTYKR
jgi:hypothetical protein